MVILTGIHKRPDASINWVKRPDSRNLLELEMMADGRILSKQSVMIDDLTQQNTHIFVDKEAYDYWISHFSAKETRAVRKTHNEENGIISTNTVIEI